MKKLFTAILSVVLVFSMSISAFAETSNSSTPTNDQPYSISADLSSVVLKVGESVTVPLKAIPLNPTGLIQPQDVFVGDIGTLTITPTATAVLYSIALAVPANTFIGTMKITDVSSGFTISNGQVGGFSGMVLYTPLKGHMYSAGLDGTAYLLGKPVARTVYNYTLWNINL